MEWTVGPFVHVQQKLGTPWVVPNTLLLFQLPTVPFSGDPAVKLWGCSFHMRQAVAAAVRQLQHVSPQVGGGSGRVWTL